MEVESVYHDNGTPINSCGRKRGAVTRDGVFAKFVAVESRRILLCGFCDYK